MLEFQGNVQLESNQYTPLSAIDLTTYDVIKKITKNGIYFISTGGIYRVKCVNESGKAVTVYGEVY